MHGYKSSAILLALNSVMNGKTRKNLVPYYKKITKNALAPYFVMPSFGKRNNLSWQDWCTQPRCHLSLQQHPCAPSQDKQEKTLLLGLSYVQKHIRVQSIFTSQLVVIQFGHSGVFNLHVSKISLSKRKAKYNDNMSIFWMHILINLFSLLRHNFRPVDKKKNTATLVISLAANKRSLHLLTSFSTWRIFLTISLFGSNTKKSV